MKTLILCSMLLLGLAGCSSSNEFGNCVGISDPQDPLLVYKPSAQNIIVGILFFEFVAPPVFVIADQFYCPVGKAEPKNGH